MQEFEEYLNSQLFYRHAMLSVLDFCKEAAPFDKLKEKILNYPTAESFVCTPVEILSLMQGFNALKTWLDNNDNVEYWQTTDYGIEISEKFDSEKMIRKLFEESPKLVNVFRDVLSFCKVDKIMTAIEEKFASDETLKSEKLLVNYCVHELERAGGIFWHSKGWKTTEIGLKVI